MGSAAEEKEGGRKQPDRLDRVYVLYTAQTLTSTALAYFALPGFIKSYFIRFACG